MENPTGSNPTSPGRVPSRVDGAPFFANGRAWDGRLYSAFKLVVGLAGEAVWKAVAEPKRAAVMANFILVLGVEVREMMIDYERSRRVEEC